MSDIDDLPAGPRRRIRVHARDEAAMRRARRHSGLVSALRIALPAMVAAAAVVFAWNVFRAGAPSMSAEEIAAAGAQATARSVLTDDSLVSFEPELSGNQGTDRAYRISAARAVQAFDDPHRVALERLFALFGLDSGATANIDAGEGLYDGDAETLDLTDGVRLSTTDGYRGTVEQGRMDLKSGLFRSDRPVRIDFSEGSLDANEIEIRDGGRRMTFRGGVSVVYDFSRPSDPPEEAAAADAQ